MPFNQIEIRTEEINEILGKSPNSIIRWGVSVLLIVVILILIGSWFFKYPDFITSSIEITTEIPPAEIVAKSNGRIEHLLVKDKDQVNKNDYLAILENSANYIHAKKLLSLLDSIKKDISEIDNILLDQSLASEKLILGEVQSSYSNFSSSNNQIINFYNINYYNKKLTAINQQIAGQKKYAAATATATANKDIVDEKILIIENLILTLESNVIDLQLQKQQQKIQLENKFQESFDNLFNQLKTWELQYVLKAPISGTCTFTNFWNTNQNIVVGDKVLTIIPKNQQSIIGKLMLPVQGSGKVKIGQKANIKLLNYPYMEYGMLQGSIRNISLVPSKNFYSVEVEFQYGMLTNYGRTLTFHQKMQGRAEIITEDIRLIERILMPIKSLIKNRSYK